MSRTIIFSLATAATIAMASLASSAADARGFGGGGFGGGGRGFSGGSHFSGGNHFAGRSVGHSRVAALSTGRGGRGGHPGHPGKPGRPGHWTHWHNHHWIFRDGIWVDIDGGVDGEFDAAPVAATPGPCTCLAKTYTPDGLVVFADVCTKEAASARVDSTAEVTPLPPVEPKASKVTPPPPADSKAADVSQAPTSTNYAGRTYKDFLAATQAAANKS
jgi:hypothetical protein